MKKTTMGIGVFMVLFLVVAAYTARAQVTDLNGTWLKFTGTMKGKVFANGPGSTEEGKNDDGSIKLYGCVVEGPFYDNQFFMQLYVKAKTATRAGAGIFQKSAGTSEKFAGWFRMQLMEGYDPANPGVYTTSASAPGKMKIKNDKINFKGFGGQAEKQPTGIYTDYGLYGVKLDAKTVAAKNLPFDEATACPAGNIIQVVKTDDGVHTGTITPAGPWVQVATNVSQEFTITTSVDCTSVSVYVDGNITTPFQSRDCVTPPGPVIFDTPIVLTPGANHSIWVVFN